MTPIAGPHKLASPTLSYQLCLLPLHKNSDIWHVAHIIMKKFVPLNDETLTKNEQEKKQSNLKDTITYRRGSASHLKHQQLCRGW